MKLKPDNEEEYRRRHDEIWPELSALLSGAGIYDYAIFLDEATLDLFAVMKLRPEHPVMRRWWDYVADLMELEPGNWPKEWSLTRCFTWPGVVGLSFRPLA